MTLPRREALKFMLSATALAGLGAAAVPPKAAADGRGLTEVSVKQYGAIGSGTTDDTAAIHAARDAAGVGGKIIIPPGTYVVSGLTASVANQTWELSDDAVIKTKVTTAAALSVTAIGVSVAGGVFDCTNVKESNGNKNGVDITADGVTIRKTKVLNSPYHGIAAYNCNQITISGCTVINSSRDGIWAQNSALPNIYEIVITDNLVDNSSAGNHAEGIGVRGNNKETQRVSRVTISRNTVRLPYVQSTENTAIGVINGTDFAVDNNVIIGGGNLGITCPDASNAVISNNVVRGFRLVGIEIPGNCNRVIVQGNVIDPDGTRAQTGIQTSAGNVNDLRITGNRIRNFPETCYLISFSSGSVSQKVTINLNYLTSAVVSGSFSGVYFNGTINDLVMTGNYVDGASSRKAWGVHFMKSVSRASINGNIFANLADAAVLMAAREAGDTLDYINAGGNVVVNCGATLKDSTANGAVVGANISS